MVNLNIENKINDLFEKLFECSDKIISVSNNYINFEINNINICLSYVRTSSTNCSINVDVDKDYHSIWCTTYSWDEVNKNPKRFVIEILNKTYVVPEMDRVSLATYVDKFEKMILDYHYNKINSLINIPSSNEEF